MPFTIERNDLAAVSADAIVVAANENLKITGGVGATVAEAAGFQQLQAACDAIGHCPTGSAVVTPGFNLSARFVVHAVGPVWSGGFSGEADALRCAYDSALGCAFDAGARSIALPLISAGTYGFPPELSLTVASDAIRAFLNVHDAEVRLVLYSRTALVAGLAAYGKVASYIDDRYVQEHHDYRSADFEDEDRPYAEPQWFETGEASGFFESAFDGFAAPVEPSVPAVPESARSVPAEPPAPAAPKSAAPASLAGPSSPAPARERSSTPAQRRPSSKVAEWWSDLAGRRQSKQASESASGFAKEAAPFLEERSAPSLREEPASRHALESAPSFTERVELSDLLDSLDEPFSTTLLSLIDARGMTDVDVYKRANMSRQHFSKIRADASYRPTKKTVLALAVALRLNLAETEDLLRRAGFALSRSSKADVIVEYFILTGKYDIFEINETLYAFDQPLL